MIRVTPRAKVIRATTAALIVAAAACTTWKAGNDGVERTLAERPSRVRVALVDGQQVELRSPVIRGDSLIGLRDRRPVAVALADIREVEVRSVSATRTILLVGAGATAIIIALNLMEDDPPPTPSDSLAIPSCPLVYSWDGTGWRLDSGTFGGAITAGLARTDVDNLDHATADQSGRVHLKVSNELAETDFLDALRLLAVDHETGTSVAPTAEGAVLAFGSAQAPSSARDARGGDALARVAARDGWSWESSISDGTARDALVLEFEHPAGAATAHLILDARNTPWAAFMLTEYLRAHGNGLDHWYATLDEDPAQARAFFGRIATDAFLEAAVEVEGEWRAQGLAWEAGPEIVKRQVIPLDLRGVEAGTVRVRLAAPASFWLIDHVAIDFGPSPPIRIREIAPARARAGDGRDVRAEIVDPDGRSWTMETGDWAEVSFSVPPVEPGRARSYLLASTGWYRIHARRSGPPDRALLARVEHEPGAIAHLSLERRQRSLAMLEEARGRR